MRSAAFRTAPPVRPRDRVPFTRGSRKMERVIIQNDLNRTLVFRGDSTYSNGKSGNAI